MPVVKRAKGYGVENVPPSKKPMTKAKAEAQLRAVEASKHASRKSCK